MLHFSVHLVHLAPVFVSCVGNVGSDEGIERCLGDRQLATVERFHLCVYFFINPSSTVECFHLCVYFFITPSSTVEYFHVCVYFLINPSSTVEYFVSVCLLSHKSLLVLVNNLRQHYIQPVCKSYRSNLIMHCSTATWSPDS